MTVRSFFRCQQIKCVACYCENSHHSRIKPFQVFLRGSCGPLSVQMSYANLKFLARSQVNVASCNIVVPVKTVCSPLTQDVNITQSHQSFCCKARQNFSRVLRLPADDTESERFWARFRSPGGDCRTVMVCSTRTWTGAARSLCDLKDSNQLLIIYFNKSVHNLFSLLWGCMRLLLLLARLDSR